jgi:hypothetical protein
MADNSAKVNPNEAPDGYLAEAPPYVGCKGCAFYYPPVISSEAEKAFDKICAEACLFSECVDYRRQDRQNVIFVTKEC